MHSTWLDPLIKAQHNHRRASVAAVELPSKASEIPATPVSRNADAASWTKRSKRAWELFDEEETPDLECDPLDLLPEMEREIGIAEWIDPQTGGPAEGQSPPHLENE